MTYRKPILREIIAEVTLTPTSLQQSHFLALGQKLGTIGLSDVRFGQVETLTINAAAHAIEAQAAPRIQCWSSDQRRVVQFSPDQFSANLVGEYLGWAAFTDLLRGALKAVGDTVGILRVEQVALITLDEMSVPRKDFTVGSYLECGGERIPSWFRSTKEACDLSLGKGILQVDGFNRVVRVVVRPEGENVRVRMESQFRNRVGPSGDVVSTIEELHKESNASFESMITNRTRNEVMGGVQ